MIIKDDQRKRSIIVTTYQNEGIVININHFQRGPRVYSRKISVATRRISIASELRILRLLSQYIPTSVDYSAYFQGVALTYRFYRWFELPASQPYPKMR